MDVILREDVLKLGKAGEVVRVKPGYARNYLLPHGLAYVATEGSKRRLESERRARAQQMALQKADAEALAARVSGLHLTFSAKTGDGDKLFGSVTAADIANKLAEAGITVDKRHVELAEPIRTIGDHAVPIRLHSDVHPEVKVTVVKEE